MYIIVALAKHLMAYLFLVVDNNCMKQRENSHFNRVPQGTYSQLYKYTIVSTVTEVVSR